MCVCVCLWNKKGKKSKALSLGAEVKRSVSFGRAFQEVFKHLQVLLSRQLVIRPDAIRKVGTNAIRLRVIEVMKVVAVKWNVVTAIGQTGISSSVVRALLHLLLLLLHSANCWGLVNEMRSQMIRVHQ